MSDSEKSEPSAMAEEESTDHSAMEVEESIEPLDVSATLARAKQQFASCEVDKDDDLEYDLHNLHALDPHPVDSTAYSENFEQCLLDTSRDNVQLLVKHIFELHTRRTRTGVIASLPPKSTFKLPREKPVPKPKPLTKWEKFAKAKGIQKKKKDKMVWDEDFGEWRRRWGYKKANNPLDKDNWIIEMKDSDFGNPFERLLEEKKERVKKQKKAEQRNVNRRRKAEWKGLAAPLTTDTDVVHAKLPNAGVERRQRRTRELTSDLISTRAATPSHGLFQEKLKGDKVVRPKKFTKKSTAVGDLSSERDTNLKVIGRVLRKKEGTVDMARAVKHHNRVQNRNIKSK